MRWTGRLKRTRENGRSRDPDWHFEVVSAVQRFICETTDAPSSQVIACGGALVTAIPRPASPGDRPILRSILFELAIEWGFRRHMRVRSRCRHSACVPVVLAMAPRYWADRSALPPDLFLSWLRQYCEELEATHPDPLAERAANWIRGRIRSPLDVKQMAKDLASNPSAIRRAVRETFHTTPRDLHERIRVEYLESLLTEPGIKIAPLADEVGWRSKKNMYRAVRHVRGCTPGSLKPHKSA